MFLADYLSEFILFIYWSMGALGVQLLIGYCGQLTLGHAAFLAVGGYSSFLLMAMPWPSFLLDMGVVYPIVLLISAVIAGIWCVIFGLPSARVKGFYLILTTMAAQFITVDFFIAKYVSQIGGRQQDLTLSSDLIKIGPWTVDNKFDVYYLGVILLTGMVFAVANHLRSRSGRAWVAIRDNDIAAEALGINIVWYKLLSFFVAGFMAGVAGAFWVCNTAALSPEHFQWFLSLWLVGVILIGGVGSIQGAIFGSIFMVVVMELLQMGAIPLADYYPKILIDFAYIKDMAFGLAICAFLIYEPNGLAYRWWQAKNYFNLWPFSY